MTTERILQTREVLKRENGEKKGSCYDKLSSTFDFTRRLKHFNFSQQIDGFLDIFFMEVFFSYIKRKLFKYLLKPDTEQQSLFAIKASFFLRQFRN